MTPSKNLDLSLIGLNRRSFLKRAGLIAALSPLAGVLLGSGQKLSAETLPFAPGVELDIAILNFALNLEYLEATYYNYGVKGQDISTLGVATSTGNGADGGVIVKANPQVSFQTPALQQYMAEIAQDEINHINFIQNTIDKLGGSPVSRPQIDLLNSFNAVAMAANIAPSFDPFANETNFYLGGFSLTDVGVTAYHGAAPLISNKTVLSGSAGILAVESYHDATLRLTVFEAGATAQSQAQAISDLRDKLDDNNKKDRDQGVVNPDGSPNIVPADKNSIVFARNPRQVLNIVYGGYKAANGGFFPAGVNGDIK